MKNSDSNFNDYIASDDYLLDLSATRDLWQRPKALGIAGMYIFLSYATIPDLIRVRPVAGQPRTSTMRLGLDSQREKQFLLGVLGLRQEDSWLGGIRNQKVQESMRVLTSQHLAYAGMQQGYMDFFAGIIAVSILRTYNNYNWPVQPETQFRYWRYVTYASLLLNVELQGFPEMNKTCGDFCDSHSSSSSEGQHLFSALQEIYPDYIALCLPILFPVSRAVVVQLRLSDGC